jgi:E3 ubiquitin-protein ligase HERC2
MADSLRHVVVKGFGKVRMRGVGAGLTVHFAIGEEGELFSWGSDKYGRLGHGVKAGREKPKRVEALRGVRVISVAVGFSHTLALAEDGLVYAWGKNEDKVLLGNPDVEWELLPRPVEALRSVCVVSIAASSSHSCALAGTGELYTWGFGPPLGQGMNNHCPLPTPVESLQGIKVVAVSTGQQTLAMANDGSVYSLGDGFAAEWGVLGLGAAVKEAGECERTAQCVPALRVACGL